MSSLLIYNKLPTEIFIEPDLILPNGSSLKVIEVPPGPPVMATLLAEIYGPDAEMRRLVVNKLKTIWQNISFIVDINDLLSPPADQLQITIDQAKLNYYQVTEQEVYATLRSLLGSTRVGYSHRKHGAYPIEITIDLAKNNKVFSNTLLSTPISTIKNGKVQLGDVVNVSIEKKSYPIFRHNGYETELLLAEVAGKFEAPIYAMLAADKQIKQANWSPTVKPAIKFYGQPKDESKPTILWDGEWEITYTTFRAMGIAFILAILGIYILLVAKFGNFKIPLIILVPIPLVLIGIILGHWLINIPFAATILKLLVIPAIYVVVNKNK